MKLKSVANGISILRILFSLSLLFIDLFSWVFVLIYLLCGISDILDGYIARRTKTQTILSIRIMSIIIVYFKYKMFAMLHTVSNKITGILLFFIPIVIGSALENPIIYFVCVIASVSAIEDLVINILSKKMEVDIKNIFRL